MRLLLLALLSFGSIAALAGGNEKESIEPTESSMNGRLQGYVNSAVVKENIKIIEAKYQVKCSEGTVDTGLMDNPLVNSNIYTAICSGERQLKVKINSKFKSLGDLPEGKMIAHYKLKKVTVKFL